MIKFQGILGNVCGLPVEYTGEDARLKAKGFTISPDNPGIETLRGFAKISDLAKASKKDEYYQRKHESTEGKNHIAALNDFLVKGKPIAKFLPEVILV